jgi:hypothetical protein
MRIEEQDKAIRQKNKVIENRDSTIEQLHRRLEHAIPGPVSYYPDVSSYPGLHELFRNYSLKYAMVKLE